MKANPKQDIRHQRRILYSSKKKRESISVISPLKISKPSPYLRLNSKRIKAEITIYQIFSFTSQKSFFMLPIVSKISASTVLNPKAEGDQNMMKSLLFAIMKNIIQILAALFIRKERVIYVYKKALPDQEAKVSKEDSGVDMPELEVVNRPPESSYIKKAIEFTSRLENHCNLSIEDTQKFLKHLQIQEVSLLSEEKETTACRNCTCLDEPFVIISHDEVVGANQWCELQVAQAACQEENVAPEEEGADQFLDDGSALPFIFKADLFDEQNPDPYPILLLPLVCLMIVASVVPPVAIVCYFACEARIRLYGDPYATPSPIGPKRVNWRPYCLEIGPHWIRDQFDDPLVMKSCSRRLEAPAHSIPHSAPLAETPHVPPAAVEETLPAVESVSVVAITLPIIITKENVLDAGLVPIFSVPFQFADFVFDKATTFAANQTSKVPGASWILRQIV